MRIRPSSLFAAIAGSALGVVIGGWLVAQTPDLPSRLFFRFTSEEVEEAPASSFENEESTDASAIEKEEEERIPFGEPAEVELDEDYLKKVLGVIQRRFYQPEELDSQELTHGAAGGLLFGTGDRFSNFFPPAAAEDFLVAVDGSLSGIGAELELDEEGRARIVRVLPGSPAKEAGLLPDDRILKVDGVAIAELSLDEVVGKIRGEIGKEVSLEILRGEEELEIEIIRAEIQLESLEIVEEEGILELTIRQFDEDTPRELLAQLDKLDAGDAAGILLDLRGNAGGFFQGAVSVAGEFLPPGTPIVIEKQREREKREISRGLGLFVGKPIVILVNGGTASAAEILAGALRIDAGAQLVGTQTFGKGTVQEIVEFGDGAVMKITVAEWLLPDGSSVNEIGLEPDVEIALTEEDFLAERDPQKEEGLKILRAALAEKKLGAKLE